MFWPRISAWMGVLGTALLSPRTNSQGSAPSRRWVSKVAPPKASIEWKPTPSFRAAMGRISAGIRWPPSRDWLPSRKVVSVSWSAGCCFFLATRSPPGQGAPHFAVPLRDVVVGKSEDAGRQPGRVLGAPLADRHRGDRDPGRHLDDRVER